MFSTDLSLIDACAVSPCSSESPILFKATAAAVTLDPSYDSTESVDRDEGSLESAILTTLNETDPVNDFTFDSIQDLDFLAFTEQTQRRLFEITHVKLSRKKQRLLLRALAANAMDAILEMKPEMEALFWKDSKLSHAMPAIHTNTKTE
ncbi:hypothetical protein HDU78_005501 [Chytriomyces hyalinus]|nr:hypothetical protein HDU78_005501 [Chytriomyces hyalinus]